MDNNLQLSFDFINFGNLLNKKWGVQKTLNNAQRLLNPITRNADAPTFRMNAIAEGGKYELPTNPFRDVTSYSSTWKMQIGLRFSF